MYVLIEHEIHNPQGFWTTALEGYPHAIPTGLLLYHTFPSPDGRRAVCIWEADSVATVRDYVEPQFGQASRSRYYEVENRDGVKVPAMYLAEPRAV
jgi:hypothetical protein